MNTINENKKIYNAVDYGLSTKSKDKSGLLKRQKNQPV